MRLVPGLLVTLLLGSGCSLDFSYAQRREGVPGISVDAAKRRVVEIYGIVMPNDPITVDQLERNGCSLSDNLQSVGPPWVFGTGPSIPNADPELIAETVRRLNTLADRGFTRNPPHPTDDQPEDIAYTDAQNYVAGTNLTINADGSTRFSIGVGSPCVE